MTMRIRAAIGSFLLAGCAAVLTGCGVNADSLASSTPETGSLGKVSGQVYGGQQPIVGAHIYVYTVGTNGYGNASVSLPLTGSGSGQDSRGYYVTTQTNGNFSITAAPVCTVGTQAYLYSYGGIPGGYSSNAAAGLLAPLGACSASGTVVPPYSFVNINEATTVVTAYALAGFATSSTSISSSGTALAATGVANAITNALNIVNIGTGTVSSTPANGLVIPSDKIYTLANALAACVNSDGSTGSNDSCGELFTDAGISSSAFSTTDTATAAIAIAHAPFSNVGDIYTLGSEPGAPFASAMTSAPADWTLGLQYQTAQYGKGTVVNYSAAFDSAGDLWTRGTNSNGTTATFVKYGPTGAALNTVTLADSSGTNGAYIHIGIDSADSVWSGLAGGEVKLSSSGSSTTLTAGSCSGFGTLSSTVFGSTGTAYAGDLNGNAIWEFNSTACTGSLTPPSGSSFKGYVAVEKTGSIVSSGYNSGNSYIFRYTSSGTESGYTAGGDFLTTDGSGDVWAFSTIGGSEYDVLNEYDSSNAGLAPSAGYPQGGFSAKNVNIRAGNEGVHIDGAGAAWVGVTPCASTGSCSPDIIVGVPANAYANGNPAITPSTGLALPFSETGAHALALDGSGNLWVAVSDGSLIEYVGLTTPVATPILYNQLGSRP